MKLLKTLFIAGLLTAGLAACADDYDHYGYDYDHGYHHHYHHYDRDYGDRY